MKRPEQLVQIGIFKHLTPRMMLEKKFVALHVPNGWKDKVEGGIRKAMGALAGAGDILLMIPPDYRLAEYCMDHGIPEWGRAFWVELKLKTYKIDKRNGELTFTTTKQEPSQMGFEIMLEPMMIPYHLVEATDINDGLNQILKLLEGYGAI